MSDAVLSGSYAGFRLVKTRRVVVVEVEVPIEALQRVLDVLGTPDPATETPVAIARLAETAAASPSSTAAEGASRPPSSKPDGGAARPRASDICSHWRNHYNIVNGRCVVCDAEWPDPPKPDDQCPSLGVIGPHVMVNGRCVHCNDRQRTPWHELTRTQQACIRCGEERFFAFLRHKDLMKLQKAEHDPAEFVRQHCGVSTRAHLDTDSIAAAMWDTLDAEYRRFAGLEAEPR